MSRTPQPAPFAEWAPDQSIQSGHAKEAKGVISLSGRYAPLNDLSEYKAGAGIAGTCIGARGYWDQSGNVHVFMGDEFDLYKLEARQPSVISRAEGYEVSASDGWQFEQFGNFIVACNANTPPQVYEIGGSVGTFADLEGDPPLARTAFRVSNQLCLANGRTLSISGFNDISDWTYGVATQGVQVDVDQRGGSIQAGVGGEVGLIFQERGIVRIVYTGGPTVFQLDTIEWKHGAISREAVSQYGRNTFYVSETGFLVTDTMQSQPIGQNRVDKFFSDNLNYSERHKVCTAIDFARKLWMIAFPTTGSNQPNHLLIYSMQDDRWTHDEIDTQMLFEMPNEGVSIDDVSSFISFEGTTDADQISTSVDDPQWRETRTQVAAVNSSGSISTFEGETRPATITTSEMQPAPLKQTLVDELWPEIDVCSTDVTGFVYTRSRRSQVLSWGDDPIVWGGRELIFGSKGTGTVSSDLNEFGFCPMRLSTRYLQMGITVEAGVGWTEATGMAWRGSAAGER